MRIAVVEDQPDALLHLENLLEQYCLKACIKLELSAFSSGEEFLAEWPQEFDAIFLDIQMRGLDGIAVAGEIRKTDEQVALVFITNIARRMQAGYAVDASDYLLKPITAQMLQTLMPRILRRCVNLKKQLIALHNNDGAFVVNMGDIRYIELAERRLLVHAGPRTIHCPGTLQSLSERLPQSFFRCHSAFIVNFHYVEQVRGNELLLENTMIPISKHRRKEFISALTRFIGENI